MIRLLQALDGDGARAVAAWHLSAAQMRGRPRSQQ